MSIFYLRRILLAGIVLAAPVASQAQQSLESLRKPSPEDRPTSRRQPLKTPDLEFDQSNLASMQAVETAVDANTYRVGPGDVFTVSFWGPAFPEPLLVVPVTPEGLLLIPSVGGVLVGGQTLAQAQAAVSRACSEKYNAGMIRATAHLNRVRLVRVHVYGEVEQPGAFIASAAERVSACLQRAGGLTEWADDSQIEIRYPDSTRKTLDLTRLQQQGDLSHDPYVQGGEVIYIPRLPLTHDVVFVEGTMPRPGPHRLLANETLADFLHRVKALDRQSDLAEVMLLRQSQAPVRLSFFADGAAHSNGLATRNGHAQPESNGTSSTVSAADAHTLRLQSGDHIVVAELKEYVYVHGAVRNPGSYPFVTGYKVADYIGLAGGTTETANLKSAKVSHRENGASEKGPDKAVQRGDTIAIPTSARKTFGDYLTFLTQAATITLAVIAAVNAVNAN